MQFAELTAAQVTQVYQERMTADFPPDELKPLSRIRRALSAGRYRCTGLFEGGELLAYGFFVILRGQDDTELLLDYFAVDAAKRGQGIGSAFLRMLPEQFPEAGAVLIESESPETAENSAERILRERRIRFYMENGCLASGMETSVFGVRYRVMELPLRKTHTPEQLRQIYAGLYRQILPPEMFREKIHFCK